MTVKTPERIKSLRQQLEVKVADIEGMANSWKDETGKGHFVLSPEEKTRYTKVVNDAQEIRDLIALEEKAHGLVEWANSEQGPSVGGWDAGAAQRAGIQVKSLGQSWIESDAYREMKASQFRQFGGMFTVEQSLPRLARAAEVKDIFTGSAGTITIPGFGQPQSVGITERQLRPGRVRDLFPVETTSANMLYGIRETGWINRAAAVAERTAADGSAATGTAADVFGLKPKSDLSLTPYSVGVSTLAHILYVHRNTLADEPRLQGLIDRDMVDGIKMVEDEQILFGDGQGENMAGLCLTQGVQKYTGVASDRYSAQLRRAMTRSILAYFNPSGVVLHPLDWEELELETDRMGRYTIATSVAIGGERRVWRMQVVDTTAMVQGRFLLGSFGYGAKLFDREQVNIVVSTENRDMFERNAVTVRAEERLALLVDRPESFVFGQLTTSTANA
jgi:HK97 family phage major capsid protein